MSTLDIGQDRGDFGLPDAAAQRATFSVGGVLRRFAAIIRDNFGVLLIFTVLLAGVLPLATGFAYGRIMLATVGAAKLKQLVPWQAGILFFIEIPLTVLLQGAVAHIGTTQRSGFDLGAPLRSAVRHFLPNLGIYILSGLAVAFASVLFLVPGLMLICRWLVAVQAEVAEGRGVGGALSRSSQLTKGHRWRVFGLILLAWAVSGVLVAVQFLLIRAMVGTSAANPILLVYPRLVSVVGVLMYYVGAAAIYLELRRDKEGGTSSEIASVFD